jgi:hypothetical protein
MPFNNPLSYRSRPPQDLDLTTQEAERLLTSPALAARMRAEIMSGSLPMHVAAEVVAQLRQFRRAELNERALPGEYNANPRLPDEPLPFQAREQHRPDRQPGSRAHAILKEAVDRVDADTVVQGLQERMSENDPATSTWARSDPAYREPSGAADLSANPPSLRESVQASMDALGGGRMD